VRHVAAIFFPQAKALGIDVDGIYCPSVLRKIVLAGTKDTSYQGASETLAEQAEIKVSAKQCERVVQRIGEERIAETEQSVAQWEALPLPQRQERPANAPQNSWEGRVAVAEFDGGRVQLRDEAWGEKKTRALGEKRSWWRESRAACLMTFLGHPSAEDPLPNLPESLRNPLFAVPRFLAMGHSGGLDSSSQSRVANAAADVPAASVVEAEHTRWSPEPLVRSVTATCQSYDHLAKITQAAAWQRGFTAADRKAFLGDGLAVNWRIHREYFSDYEPIVDLMHALSYVYASAIASSGEYSQGWRRYEDWANAVWQGRVEAVIHDIRLLQATPLDEAALQELERSLTYLSNNASRMHYAKYRRLGLPLTTSHIESVQKQLNIRLKGTEKYWCRDGVEPVLHLRADRISQTNPLKLFWKRRSRNQTGFRKRHAHA
jgi:hypothetical protein